MNRSLRTLWIIIRVAVFTTAAVMLFLFPEFFRKYAAFVVGSVMILFAVDDMVRLRIFHGRFRLIPTGLIDLSSIFLGILMMIFLNATASNIEHLIKVCTIWAVWSIIQSAFELYEFAMLFQKKKLGILGMISSIAVIVLSVFLLFDPETHVFFHIIILGIEMILKYAFGLFYEFIYRAKQRKLAA